MFLTVYIPIFDMRDYFSTRGTRTRRPAWPAPDLSPSPFQRNLGAIVDRKLGGIRGWVAENSVCEIRESLRLVTPADGDGSGPQKIAFKRFYADGRGGAQFSIGVAVPHEKGLTLADQRLAIGALLDSLLQSKHRPTPVAIRKAGAMVADLFATGTTKGNKPNEAVTLVHHGRPLILLQGLDLTGTDANADGPLHNLSGSFGTGVPGPVIALTSDGNTRDSLRASRMILARLYLELFCFERCVALITSPAMAEVDDEGRNALLDRLGMAARRLKGARAPRLAREAEIYGQLGAAFGKVHRPGRLDELEAALTGNGSDRKLARAVLGAAQFTDVISADPSASPSGVVTVTNNNFINNGQAGAFGTNAQASNFTQAWADQGGSIDLKKLSVELAELQTALTKEIAEKPTPELLESATAVAKAKEAADKADGPGVLGHLANAGKWALRTAEKIGVSLTAAVIKQQLGL